MLDEWDGLPILERTPFHRGGTMGADANGATGGGPWCEFDEYNGGIHNGVADQSMSFALAFDAANLYMGTNTIVTSTRTQAAAGTAIRCRLPSRTLLSTLRLVT